MLALILSLVAPCISLSTCSADNLKLRPQFDQLYLSQLEQQLQEVDQELASLANFRLRSGIGVIGYRSQWRGRTDRSEWVKVAFDREYSIDEIVLVPTLSRDTDSGYQSDGFPDALRIVAGTNKDSEGEVIAEFTSRDRLQPRVGPLVIQVDKMTAGWVRVEAIKLSTRAFDGEHVFQLSEVFVFSGLENVALRQTVTSSSNSTDRVGAWDKGFLVDGHTPYLMDSSDGSQSLAYVSRFGERPNLYLDLGKSYPVSEIHLHAVDQDDTVPQAYAGDLGIPNRLKIEGATEEDFSDATLLLDYQRTNINDLGPIMMWQIPETNCQYVRLIASEAATARNDLEVGETSKDIRIGFAEIELYANAKNVAKGKRAFTDYKPNPRDRSPSALTDGKNLFGEILPTRVWLNELASRHDLEAVRPLVVAELNDRYARQTANLTRVTWLAAFLAIGIGVTFLVDRILRMRQLAQLRMRFAADLHDELGADLHVIGLLSDLATAAKDSPDKLQSMHQRIRTMTQRSSDAVRYCTNMLEAKGLYGDLREDMQRTTERIMADIEGRLTLIDEQDVLSRLKPRTRADLFLFYKESLVNISRHSNATHFDARLEASPSEICLIVRDDGAGLADIRDHEVPASLVRRAKLLGASVVAEQPDTGGTCITLKMKTKKWGFRK